MYFRFKEYFPTIHDDIDYDYSDFISGSGDGEDTTFAPLSSHFTSSTPEATSTTSHFTSSTPLATSTSHFTSSTPLATSTSHFTSSTPQATSPIHRFTSAYQETSSSDVTSTVSTTLETTMEKFKEFSPSLYFYILAALFALALMLLVVLLVIYFKKRANSRKFWDHAQLIESATQIKKEEKNAGLKGGCLV